eukprot:CAMPEP_0194214968 /NCGR_PEP_ID=MMETSP0156-20130528/16429_1 /TAXON_ID=33649 /ORGANISM="Thalassionema nitzschioides, Strain L26-B" /LENGTH=54 /DNA_ID=CAMNT_0038943357 /DNA_START=173 /DNA_END=337 /DNA_ORIENTATION=+
MTFFKSKSNWPAGNDSNNPTNRVWTPEMAPSVLGKFNSVSMYTVGFPEMVGIIL